jgi:hypothetical protein
MGFAVNPNNSLDYTTLVNPRRYLHCSECDTPGEMVQRAEGYVVICPNPACIAPARPFREVCGNPQAAAQFWKHLQRGTR